MSPQQDLGEQQVAHREAPAEQGTGATRSVRYDRPLFAGLDGAHRPLGVCVTAAEVHAHAAPVPADLQPPLQRGLFPNRAQALRLHLRLPVSPPARRRESPAPRLYNVRLSSSSGSHIENWHSILRSGLVNASYTKLQVEWRIVRRTSARTSRVSPEVLTDGRPSLFQLHGAAYGKGIYLSPVSSVSFGYSGTNIRLSVSKGLHSCHCGPSSVCRDGQREAPNAHQGRAPEEV